MTKTATPKGKGSGKSTKTKEPLAPLGERAAHDPKLLAKALGNKALRGELPDNLLTAPYLAARQKNQRVAQAKANAPLSDSEIYAALSDPTTPLSGKAMTGAATMLSRKASEGTLKQYDVEEARASKSASDRMKMLTGAFNQIAAGGANAIGAQQAAGDAALAGQQAGVAASQKAVQAAADTSRTQGAQAAGVHGDVLNAGAGQLIDGATQQRAAETAAAGQATADRMKANQQTISALLGGQAQGAKDAGTARVGSVDKELGDKISKIAAARVQTVSDADANTAKTMLSLRGTEGDRQVAREANQTAQQKAIMDFKIASAGIKSKEKLAALGDTLKRDLAAQGVESAETIAKGQVDGALEVAKANNKSSETVAAAHDKNDITTTGMTADATKYSADHRGSSDDDKPYTAKEIRAARQTFSALVAKYSAPDIKKQRERNKTRGLPKEEFVGGGRTGTIPLSLQQAILEKIYTGKVSAATKKSLKSETGLTFK